MVSFMSLKLMIEAARQPRMLARTNSAADSISEQTTFPRFHAFQRICSRSARLSYALLSPIFFASIGLKVVLPEM